MGIRKFGATLTEGGPVVPKGTLRAPVSPFQTTVWRYGDKRTRGDLGGNQNIAGGRTKKRERWKKRRRGGEQTDNHRRPQATLIRMQTSISHLYNTVFCRKFPSVKVFVLLPVKLCLLLDYFYPTSCFCVGKHIYHHTFGF